MTVTHHQSGDSRTGRLSGRVSLVTAGNIGVADGCPAGIGKSGGQDAPVTMCIGGGQGIAAIFERV